MLKSIYKFILIFFISSYAYSGINDFKSYNLIQHEELSVYFIDSHTIGFFSDALYDEEKSRLEFETKNEISIIHIFDSDLDMKLRLPVGSNKIILQKSLFSPGHNRLGFLIDGSPVLRFTEVFIN